MHDLKYKELAQILMILSQNKEKLFHVFTSMNIMQMTKLSEVTRMRYYSFVKLVKDYFDLVDDEIYPKDSL